VRLTWLEEGAEGREVDGALPVFVREQRVHLRAQLERVEQRLPPARALSWTAGAGVGARRP
jgi:hypothetical protein